LLLKIQKKYEKSKFTKKKEKKKLRDQFGNNTSPINTKLQCKKRIEKKLRGMEAEKILGGKR
jgi:hypothetical protein